MPQQGHNSNNYGRALMSAILQAIAPNPHTNLLIVYVYIYICRLQIKWGLKKLVYECIVNIIIFYIEF
jgi:hypothetical protein